MIHAGSISKLIERLKPYGYKFIRHDLRRYKTRTTYVLVVFGADELPHVEAGAVWMREPGMPGSYGSELVRMIVDEGVAQNWSPAEPDHIWLLCGTHAEEIETQLVEIVLKMAGS